MRRSAFTLMELLVSVALLTLIVLFMYGAIASSKLANKTLDRHTKLEQNRTMTFNLLYRDLFESLSLETIPTQDKHFTLVQLQTHNTLHEIIAPHVTYFVDSQSKKLIRLEAARKIILPIPYEDKHLIHADVILSDVTDFNLYSASKGAETTAVNNTLRPSDDESLSSSEDVNVTDQNRSNDQSYLLYIKAKTLTPPLLLELSI